MRKETLEPESSQNGTDSTVNDAAATSPAAHLFAALNEADMASVNAILNKHPEIVNERDEERRVPLHYAADCADWPTFQRIFDLAPSLIDAEDSAGLTPLLIAVMSSHIDALRLLINRGSRLSHVDRDGHTCVHWAVVCGEFEALIMLLRAGARVESEDIYGARPLHYATVMEDTPPERAQSVLHALLKEGAEMDARDSDGRTPLLWAASNGNVEAFKSLVQAGSDKHAVDRDRLGVLHCAASNGHVRIIQRMLASSHRGVVSIRDCNGDTPLFYAATFGHCECVRVLLEGGADPNHLDRRLRTAAHCAAAKGHSRLLKLLKQYGASFEFQNYRGDLPFHEAVQTGSKELVEWLLQIEPKFLSTPNFYGRTALHLASAAGNMELVVLLCTRGATINPLVLYHDQLFTPLDLALQRDHQLVADYLRGRHEALRAESLPDERTRGQRASIVEQLKTAKLRKARAQAQSTEWEESDSIDGGGGGGYTDEDYVFDENGKGRRGHHHRRSRRGRSREQRGGRNWASFDQTSLQSRRSSSASEMRRLRRERRASSKRLEGKENSNRPSVVHEQEYSLERKLAQEAIEKIVREELRKATELSKLEEMGVRRQVGENSEDPHRDEVKAPCVEATANDGGDNRHAKKGVKVLKEEPVGTESSESAERMKKRKKREKEEDGRDTYTELHIIDDGWEPYERNNRQTGGTAAERRYMHEKSIFEELTHLKRMQIQYGKVQEKILVRSLINNFCKTHGLNPAHFRYTTLLEWEKFLYDQLKMIYIEERSRIQAAAGAPRMGGGRSRSMLAGRRQGHAHSSTISSRLFSGGRFDGARANKPSLLDDRLRELSHIYTSGSSSMLANGSAAAMAARSPMSTASEMARKGKGKGKDTVVVGGQKRCECLGKHLLLN